MSNGLDASSLLFFAETLLVFGVLLYVPYTEIDWKAYMDEVHGVTTPPFDLNYLHLKGDTGPLVYPGGFVWLYSGLSMLTAGGTAVESAQCLFWGLYVMLLALVFRFYRRTGVPLKVLITVFLSKRIRSVVVLRLFNDTWAIFFAYLMVAYFAFYRRFRLGCFVYSISVSIKMNTVLFAPGLLFVLFSAVSIPEVIVCFLIGLSWQLLSAAPFLCHNAPAYLEKAFELKRVFTQKWSVNYQFLPPDIFVSPVLSLALVGLTVLAWGTIAWRRWRHRRYTVSVVGAGNPARAAAEERRIGTAILLTLLESNFIGVAFSRSMHYQFIIWFIFGLPLLLHFTRMPSVLRFVVMAAIRYGFEVYPPQPRSSAAVMGGLLVAVLAVLFFGDDQKVDRSDRAALQPKPRKEKKPKEPKETKELKEKKGTKGSKGAKGPKEPAAVTKKKQ
ncbi:alpha-1,3-mannosyltransferase [Strigomonas culicis]|uniref:dolichyl-P-Man:Man5GlcNAc2-PP-dolichol alpha-1,3-mannosyltransferase n=1 Tax=Strigomonas culicis TaxID=28005 RepID=S9VW00_9TRYP|nr:alpha-1,3-mannosyltransferase [Strigomonas culicis]EPY27665.1 alpha-1,3-mannosyltransferase [Strigomonas culicis]EPY28472.1 alpha-1,3-mannosyltransferase [Strigomonas culicis]|eukprot:EPY23616.1 alpha-1,3-mannosyltransferase [Strigomonas culicis]